MMGWSGRWDSACGGRWGPVFLSACGLLDFCSVSGVGVVLAACPLGSVEYCVCYAWCGSAGSVSRHQFRPSFVVVSPVVSHLPGDTFRPGCWIPCCSGRRGAIVVVWMAGDQTLDWETLGVVKVRRGGCGSWCFGAVLVGGPLASCAVFILGVGPGSSE